MKARFSFTLRAILPVNSQYVLRYYYTKYTAIEAEGQGAH